MESYDFLLKGALCIDPSYNIHESMDIAISGNKIVRCQKKIYAPAKQIINVDGYLVVPGLIDFHTHIYYGGTDIGINADTAYLPTGVTSVVDAGSTGSATFEAYMKGCVAGSLTRIKSFINICPTGLGTTQFHEDINPEYFDFIKTKMLVEKYPDQIIGLKIRASQGIMAGNGLEYLRKAIGFATKLNLPIAVHTTNPSESTGNLADLLRPGDIYVHCYQGTGFNIIEQGSVSEAIRRARARGVLFDAANGSNHWVFEIAEQALQDGFMPDVISTDLTVKTMFKEPVHSLPYVMSKYLNLGMKLDEIIRACTANPASLMKMDGEIGTLREGAYADLAVMKIENQHIKFTDTNRKERWGSRTLVNKMTIKDGVVVYRALDCL